MNWLSHLALYGGLGWCIEILFTGFYSAILERNVKASGKTYLWMFPIYGITGIGFEGLKYVMVLGTLPLAVRVLVYLTFIYGVEYTSGLLLRQIIGHCPWDYGNRKWAVNGLIKLDYAPFWFALCWLIEPTQNWLEKVVC